MPPSKLTIQLAEEIGQYISEGLTYEDSCKLIGITRKTFYRWRKKAEKAKSGEWLEYHKIWDKAEMKNKQFHIKKIKESKDWRSSAYTLQNKYPNEYSDKTKVEASVEYKGLKGLADALKD